MDTTSEWGRYSPPAIARLLRLFVSAGFSRGGIKKWVLKRWNKLGGGLVDAEVRGIKYRLNIQDNVTDRQILAASKEYDRKELLALQQASRNDVFIDIGANIGYYSLTLAAHGARKVLAFEPNPPTLERLKFNVSVNRFDELITIIPIGIGDEGSFELYSRGDLGSASLLPQEGYDSVTILTKPLLNVINEQKITSIGGLKIDIEGMEDQALLPFFENAPKSVWPKCIVLEHCNQEDWKTDIVEFLQAECGYTILHRTRGNTTLRR